MPQDPGAFGTVVVDDNPEIRLAQVWMGIKTGATKTQTGSGAGGYSAKAASAGASAAAAPPVTGTVISDWDPVLAQVLAGDGF